MALDFTHSAPSETPKQMRGRTAFLRGQAAEEQVARHYQRHGARLLHTRWRGASGEIDLVFAGLSGVIFVEVKASRTHARAADSLRPQQMARLCQAAEEFLGTQPRGALTPMRFDVALLDAQGQIEILENAVIGG